MVGDRGKLVYTVYRALTYGLSPLLYLQLQWRKLRGLEHPFRWQERLGRPSLSRPPGQLFWFHAVSLGEGMAAIPLIKYCVQRSPNTTILMTTTITSAFEVIKNRLPSGVIYQFAPFDTPAAMDAFLGSWKPNAIILMESELWPNLIMGASKNGIALALLNARMSEKSFNRWSRPVLLPLISLMLSQFSLIAPLSTMQAIRFQLLEAPPFIINFSGDLKYTVEEIDISEREVGSIEDLQLQLAHRQVSNEGELSPLSMMFQCSRVWSAVVLGVHKVLVQMLSDMVTIIVPRYPHHGREIALELQKEGLNVALRSRHEKLMPGTNIYVVDTLGELKNLYRLSPIAVIGGSFLPGSAGHNISEAAAAGCAVLTGHNVGHFSHMVVEMQRLNPLSVLQVSGKLELEAALIKLFNDAKVLEARRLAAKQTFHALSSGVVADVWNLLDFHVFRRVC